MHSRHFFLRLSSKRLVVARCAREWVHKAFPRTTNLDYAHNDANEESKVQPCVGSPGNEERLSVLPIHGQLNQRYKQNRSPQRKLESCEQPAGGR